jgi:2-desacetyl-2-hydroxyethyl bacteriochlorophyllide A dehydrogenase
VTASTVTTMRRVVVSPSGVDVVASAIPPVAPGEVRVRSIMTGICGSDTHAAQGRHPFIRLPFHPGHEVVGIVDAVAADVESAWVGQRVTVEPYLPCWHCKPCRSGRENLCEHLRFFGCGYDQGALADYFTIDARRLHRVPGDLTDHAAALIEPLATPVHAIGLAGGVTGRTVAVLGAGAIGLLLLRVALDGGATRVVVADRMGLRRDRAFRFGAHASVDAGAPDVVDQICAGLDTSADVVFDCVTTGASVRTAIATAHHGGTVVVVGVPTSDVSVPLPTIQDQQIRLQGTATYLPEDFAESIELLRRGVVAPDDLVTSVYRLDDVASAFAQAATGQEIKVLIDVAGGG